MVNKLFFAFSALASTLTWAADAPAAKITGGIDTRPSWVTQSGLLRTENTIDLGVALSPTLSLGYSQSLYTSLKTPKEDSIGNEGTRLDVGFLRAKVKDVYKNDSGLSLGYEGRVYLPVDEPTQKIERIAAVRNYLKLSQKINDTVKVSLFEVPIVMITNKVGVGNSANTVFENRVYLITDLQLTEKLSLSLPIMFHQTRKANYLDTAKNNNSWTYWLWINPELDYAINDNYTVGISYYNDAESLAASDLSGLQIGKGLESGVFQLVFAATL